MLHYLLQYNYLQTKSTLRKEVVIMTKQLTTKEKVIQFLISEYNKDNNKTTEITISRTDVENLGLSEAEASKTIHLLASSNYLTIKRKSVHNDFSMFWTVDVNESCINYFKNKKESKTEKRRKFWFEIRAWITLLISLLAFGLSIFSLYLQHAPTK